MASVIVYNDFASDFSTIIILFNGESYKVCLVMLKCYGDNNNQASTSFMYFLKLKLLFFKTSIYFPLI